MRKIYLGKYQEGSNCYDVCMDISNLGKENYSILMSGAPGAGKTVAAQYIMKELADAGITVVGFDIHNTMTPDQVIPELREAFEQCANRLDAYKDSICCQLLTTKTYQDGCQEQTYDLTAALSEIVSKVYGFGVAQRAALSQALEDAMSDGSYERSGFSAVEGKLSSDDRASASVKQRLHTLFMHNVFKSGQPFWERGKINILDLSKYDSQSQRVISEMILFHIWHNLSSLRSEPIFVCIDEFQNIGMHKEGILSRMIAEGRKYSLNLILITQSLGIHFNDQQQRLLCQMRFKMFFRPSEADLKQCASLVSGQNISDVKKELRHLKVGECIISGPVYINDANHPEVDPILLRSKFTRNGAISTSQQGIQRVVRARPFNERDCDQLKDSDRITLLDED